jgi:hypothetical protein
MNTYEKRLSTDTVLSGGLIAAGIAWVVFAAAQGAAATADGAAYVTSAPQGATVTAATPRAARVPADGVQTVAAKVSREG